MCCNGGDDDVALFWFVGASSRTHAMKASPSETLWFLFVIGAVVFGAIFAGAIGITLGSRNIGADLATGSAEFLLTRPRSRSYFVENSETARSGLPG